jgi:hypothetical protein
MLTYILQSFTLGGTHLMKCGRKEVCEVLLRQYGPMPTLNYGIDTAQSHVLGMACGWGC